MNFDTASTVIMSLCSSIKILQNLLEQSLQGHVIHSHIHLEHDQDSKTTRMKEKSVLQILRWFWSLLSNHNISSVKNRCIYLECIMEGIQCP